MGDFALPSLPQTIARYQLMAKKALGQHFLLDSYITERIAACADIQADAHVIEIGPGPGGLTRALLESKAAHIYAVEMDSRCVEALKELQAAYPGKLTVIEGDALKTDLLALSPAPRQIVANLPYNVGTALLIQWLEAVAVYSKDAFTSMTLMFQKEVAERVAAEIGTKDYGRVSIFAQWLCDIVWQFDLPPEAFSPPPKVTSSVITLIPREKPLYPADKDALEKVVAAAFGQRRKMLRGSLKSLGLDTEALLAAAGIDGTRRAEELSVEEFCKLAQSLKMV